LLSEIARRRDAPDKRLHLAATRPLGGGECMVEKGTAGIGIDFDKARAVKNTLG